MPQFFEDAIGQKLSRAEVEKLAYDNIRGSLSTRELVEFYIGEIPDNELLEWATDDNGEFPDE